MISGSKLGLRMGVLVGLGVLVGAPGAVSPTAGAQDSAEQEGALPTGEEIHRRSIEANGGTEARERITSRRMVAHLTTPTPGVVVDWEILEAKPGKRVVRVSFRGRQMYELGTDGAEAWGIEPGAEPQLLEGTQKRSVIEDARLGRENDAAAIYESIETVRRAEFAGQPVYEVAVITKEGSSRTHFYSVETGLLIGRESPERPEEGALATRVTLSDFRELDGLMVPFRTDLFFPSTGSTQVMTVTSVEHNAAIDPELFALPEQLRTEVDAENPGG